MKWSSKPQDEMAAAQRATCKMGSWWARLQCCGARRLEAPALRQTQKDAGYGRGPGNKMNGLQHFLPRRGRKSQGGKMQA